MKAFICRNWPKLRCFMSSAALYKTRQCGRGNRGMIKPNNKHSLWPVKPNIKYIKSLYLPLLPFYERELFCYLFIICKPFYPPSSFERTLWVSKAFKSNISTSGSQRLRRMCKFIGVKLGPSSETFWKVEFYFQSSTSVKVREEVIFNIHFIISLFELGTFDLSKAFYKVSGFIFLSELFWEEMTDSTWNIHLAKCIVIALLQIIIIYLHLVRVPPWNNLCSREVSGLSTSHWNMRWEWC